MIRVLIDGFIYGVKPGGIRRYFDEILVRLGQPGTGVEAILHLPHPVRATPPRAPHIRYVKEWGGRPRSIFGPLSQRVARWRTSHARPTLFHSTYYTLPPRPGLPSVLTIHDMIPERFPALASERGVVEQKRRAVQAARRIIVISEYTKQQLLHWMDTDASRIHVIHLAPSAPFTTPVDPARAAAFREELGLGQTYWLYVGRRGGYKNFATLLRALPEVCKHADGKLLVVGGEPSLDAWEMNFLIQHGLEERVVVLRHLDDAGLAMAYSAAAAFVMPSLDEGFGIPITEAMAAGAPVVCADIPVFHEVAGDAGLFAAPHSVEELAQRLLQALDPDVRKDCIHKGRQRAADFSWDKTAAATIAVYRQAIEG